GEYPVGQPPLGEPCALGLGTGGVLGYEEPVQRPLRVEASTNPGGDVPLVEPLARGPLCHEMLMGQELPKDRIHPEDPGILVHPEAGGPNRRWHGVQELADAVFRADPILSQDSVDPLRRGQFHEMAQVLSVSRTLLPAYVRLPAL